MAAMTISRVSVAVIGGGTAGIAAATAASADGASVILIEREKRLGGRMNQAIQNGFGFMRYDEALTGPQYVHNDVTVLHQTKTVVLLQTSVLSIEKIENAFQIVLSNRHGLSVVEANAIVLAQGCREQTMLEHGIYGAQPSGVFTAGMAQYFLNVMGQLPVQKCFILGSSNLALHTARALALSGAQVGGVYEPGSEPAGYLDYVSLCLFDLEIPIYFNYTVTRVFGTGRIRAMEIAKTDAMGNPVRGTEGGVRCEGLIISGRLIPQTDIAVSLGVDLDPKNKTPLCDNNNMTSVDGVFAAGSGQHISDLVDYVYQSGEIAGRGAARYMPRERQLVELNCGNEFLAVSPRYIDYEFFDGKLVIFFNPAAFHTDSSVCVICDNDEVHSERFDVLKPSETQRIEVDFGNKLTLGSTVGLRIEHSY